MLKRGRTIFTDDQQTRLLIDNDKARSAKRVKQSPQAAPSQYFH